ncbi:hypothetical protein N0V93_005144 [Gnomoniopsis smithogilvyi]|uniref:YwbE n=1 Tax=Gnomoniopsis smithogilvyi TaxID=1191159 RepID=A0A9W8YSC8_9PEZI|nr:hypothetical protein N0V93_005144 [Gnomoniopsis smithogilvyi]
MNRQRPTPGRHPAVPKTTAVVPGAAVNIVLKADQPTGRTVSGVVRDVLTRGNHPRGIKVRLADGRVGRVQSMASSTSASPGDPGGVVEGASMARSGLEDGGYGRRGGEEAGEGLPSQQIGLEAFIKEAKPKQKRKGKASGAAGPEQEQEPEAVSLPLPETATCPVCGDFEGDEAAVSHHVASHFDSAS